MKQKLALARALLHRPRLVLLDEPTAGLDVQSAVAIRKDLHFLSEKEEVTIFLTTHNMDEAEKLCNQVAVIRSGKIVGQGKPDELKARAGGARIEITGHGFSPQVLDRILNLPQVTALSSQNSQLNIDMTAGTDPSVIVNLLVANGVQIEEVRRTRASLEEVFLQLTGGSDV